MSLDLSAITIILGLLAPSEAQAATTCPLTDWSYSSSYKICFYDCAGEKVTRVVNSTEECPETTEQK